MPIEVARLETVPLREVWKDEARDFTPWLAEHPEPLAEALHMDLELVDKEVSVGPFSADLVFREVASDQIVVVENFLEKTDHDHLGKLITYAAGLDARWAVLVAKSFRPEHRTALTWLNSISEEGSGFFGVEVRAVRICEGLGVLGELPEQSESSRLGEVAGSIKDCANDMTIRLARARRGD